MPNSPLNITITINGRAVEQQIGPGATVMVNCPVNSITVGM